MGAGVVGYLRKLCGACREESVLQVTSRAVFTNLAVKLQNLATMSNLGEHKGKTVLALVSEGCRWAWL